VLRVLTAAQSRSLEEQAVKDGTGLATLMAAAGLAVADLVAEKRSEGGVVVFAGAGNNGGDGWVAARELMTAGRRVRVLSVCDPEELTGVARDAAREAIAAGVGWDVPDAAPSPDALAEATVIVDALLGTGAKGALRPPLDAWVAVANRSGCYLVAVDVPTGVDSDSGAIAGDAVRADCTVTFSAPKVGLLLHPGASHAGEVVVVDIGMGFPAPAPGEPQVWSASDYASLLPLPAPDAHKNSRGRLLVVAGSRAYPGAAVLAARGAMRCGAGYVRLAVPCSIARLAQGHLLAAPVVGLEEDTDGTLSQRAAEEILSLAESADAVVLGPGLTQTAGVAAVVRDVTGRLGKPLVLDADALNVLADDVVSLQTRDGVTVLTPHAGEMGRLLGTSAERVQSDRLSASAALAGNQRVVVLKGAGTVVCGSGRQVISTVGTPALATAGTGDVLSGVIGALLAQGLGPLEAGALGVHLHGRAGEAAESELTVMCVTAEDVPDYLSAAVAELLALQGTTVASDSGSVRRNTMAREYVRDIMTPDPVTIGLKVSVTDAARLMVEKGIGALPVVDEGKLVGIVTEGDLIMKDIKLEYPTYLHLLDGFIMYPPSTARFEQELKKAVAATVGDVMTQDVIAIQVSATIEEVATLLVDENISRLPVLDGDKVVGMVTKSDVLRSIVGGVESD
jgi:ADP-dependent NAD(P)H-hydrate dehydratase / NAD(P)H-hydrate epimerase